MANSYQTELFTRIHSALIAIPMIDCHEHLQPEHLFPTGNDIHIGRLFLHYANSDLKSAGMPTAEMDKVIIDPDLEPRDRFALLAPWYKRAWNTGYCEAIRIAIRDLYDIEELTADSADTLTAAMQAKVKPGFTREVFDKAGIAFAMNQALAPEAIFNSDQGDDCFLPDMTDHFTGLNLPFLSELENYAFLNLDDYLGLIDTVFDKYSRSAGAFKVGRAYDRTLSFADRTKKEVEPTFNRLLAFMDRPDQADIRALEDYILHYLCRKCGEYGIRMKFHTGIQEGNGNIIMNSRAALLANLFIKFPKTNFDIYHISYPYQEELVTISKNFPNVTIDFAWMWIINPTAGSGGFSQERSDSIWICS